MYDRDRRMLDRLPHAVLARLDKLHAAGLLEEGPSEIVSRIQLHDSVEGAVKGAIHVQENIAESLAILDGHRKLFQIHLNDNYKDADPDMILGSVNFWEILEFYYYLGRSDYDGWQAIDIIAPRDDRAKSLQAGVMLVRRFGELADRLLARSKEIEANMDGYRFADNITLITELLFPR